MHFHSSNIKTIAHFNSAQTDWWFYYCSLYWSEGGGGAHQYHVMLSYLICSLPGSLHLFIALQYLRSISDNLISKGQPYPTSSGVNYNGGISLIPRPLAPRFYLVADFSPRLWGFESHYIHPRWSTEVTDHVIWSRILTLLVSWNNSMVGVINFMPWLIIT